MAYLVEAIIRDASPYNPEFNGDYFKIIFRSDNPNVDVHMQELQRIGYRPLSVKSRPAADEDLAMFSDRQGNTTYVDGKQVHTGIDNGGGNE